MTISECATPEVMYCYENDDLETAARHMGDLQVQRLIVLDNADHKRLRGVVSLGDISRAGDPSLARNALEGISAKAA
jgi:CBS domain-containing protein